jgi:hypothetical protein
MGQSETGSRLPVCSLVLLLLHGGVVPAALGAPANFYTVTPCRVFDSRQPADAPALASGTPRTIDIGGACAVPADASSVAVNVAATGPTSVGYLRLYATGLVPPSFSVLNFSAGETRGNNSIVRLSAGGQVDALATMPVPGTVDVLVDVFGYFLDDVYPAAVDDEATLGEDAPASTIDVLANDADPDGGARAVASTTQPANGTVVITSGGADLTYQPDPDYCNAPPGTTPDTFTYTLSPGGATATVTVTVTCVNDAPVLGAGGGSPTYTEDAPAVAVDPALTVADVDDVSLESATVTVTNLLNAGAETLAASTGGTSIAASYLAPTLTLTGTDTLANYQAVLRSVAYSNSSQSPSPVARIVSFRVNDGTTDSNLASTSVSVVPVNDAPSIVLGGGSPTFTEDGPPVVVDPVLAVADPDSPNLAFANVRITNLLDIGLETLTASTAGTSIVAVFITPTLVLSGSDTVAHYQAVLRTVAYNNASGNPDPTDRSLSLTTSDGVLGSTPVFVTVHVVPVDDAPVP